jgi:pilus assembly protein CpaB
MKSKLIFILALIFGLMAAYLAYHYLDQRQQSMDNREYTQVLVAAQDIPANTSISTTMVQMKVFPSEFRNNKEILDLKQALGKISLVNISRGEVILENRLIKPGDRKQGLAYVIAAGMRAMSVPVDEVSGVAGLIKKGDRVDIIAELSGGDSVGPARSVVVLQNVEVLAIGSSLGEDPKAASDKTVAAKTVTVSVTLENSLRLKTALEGGKISLILRSPVDKGTSNPAPFGAGGFNVSNSVPAGTV